MEIKAHILFADFTCIPFVVCPSDQTVARSRRPDKVVADMHEAGKPIKVATIERCMPPPYSLFSR